MADVLHHSPNLKEWFSLYPEDKVFGAKHDFFKHDLMGRNTYVNPPFNTFENKQNLIEKVIKKVSDSLQSNLPTRVVLLVPIFDGEVGHLYEDQARKSRFLEIATSPKNSFSFVAPEHSTTTFSLDFSPERWVFISAQIKLRYRLTQYTGVI